MISTEIPFMISIIQGIINVMHLFTKRFVFVSVAFASSKRSSSCFSRLKARITRIPVRISLVTRFSLSISVWSFVNFGMAMAKSIPISTRISTTPTPRIQVMEELVCSTRSTPPRPRIGA